MSNIKTVYSSRQQGKIDSKEIDLNQRALKDGGSGVKKEKK